MTKKLQQKGYDAVIDLWDVGFSECPIYVFDRKKKLKTVSFTLPRFPPLVKVSVDLNKNKNYNLFGAKSPLTADRFEKNSISFEGKMEDREALIKGAAYEIALYDFGYIAESIEKYGYANTGGLLIEIHENSYPQKPIHIWYPGDSDDGCHLYCDKNEFKDVLNRVKPIMVEKKYTPEEIETFDKSIGIIDKALEITGN